MESTPPFLLWALEQACPLRQIDQWTDPERTERHLRAAREAGDGIAEGRVIDGICLGRECFAAVSPATPTGFDVAAALAMYGGEAIVRGACMGCPANVGPPSSFAGCFGLLPLPEGAEAEWSALAAASPLVGEVARVHSQRIPLAASEFAAALSVAAEMNLPLHVRRFPAGRIEGRRWIVPAHCERCGAVRLDSQPCPACGSDRPPVAERRRHVRGTRPYFDLTRLVGIERAAELLGRIRRQ